METGLALVRVAQRLYKDTQKTKPLLRCLTPLPNSRDRAHLCMQAWAWVLPLQGETAVPFLRKLVAVQGTNIH